MLTKTSPNGFVFPTSVRPAGAILADFDIDGTRVKSDHTDWLHNHIVEPALARKSRKGVWIIDLNGRASRSGSDEHNLQLSWRRVRAVQSYLMPRMAGIPVQMFTGGQGEAKPYNVDEYEHEMDRSVEVRAEFASTPPTRRKIRLLIPKSIPWRPPANRKVRDFTLTVLKATTSITGFEFKAGVFGVANGTANAKLLIRIDEVGTPDFALYNMEAFGPGTVVSAGAPSLKGAKPGIGFTRFSQSYLGGDSHLFSTEVDLDAQDFGGPGMFHFDLFSNTLAFGPDKGFFKAQEKIRKLTLGQSPDADSLKHAEGTVAGNLELVEMTPEWAR
jgi:hypothetical protein